MLGVHHECYKLCKYVRAWATPIHELPSLLHMLKLPYTEGEDSIPHHKHCVIAHCNVKSMLLAMWIEI